MIPESEWNKQAEEIYRNWLGRRWTKADLSSTETNVAKLALSYAVCELLDAGRIPSQGVDLLRAIFKRSDELLLGLEPAIRPECIVVPKAKDRDVSHNHDEWLGNIEQGITQFVDQQLFCFLMQNLVQRFHLKVITKIWPCEHLQIKKLHFASECRLNLVLCRNQGNSKSTVVLTPDILSKVLNFFVVSFAI